MEFGKGTRRSCTYANQLVIASVKSDQHGACYLAASSLRRVASATAASTLQTKRAPSKRACRSETKKGRPSSQNEGNGGNGGGGQQQTHLTPVYTGRTVL